MAIGQILVTFVEGSIWWHIGKICQIIGPILLGVAAKDMLSSTGKGSGLLIILIFATLQFGCEVARTDKGGTTWSVGFHPTDSEVALVRGYTK